MQLKAVEQRRPILVVRPYAESAVLQLYPAGLDADLLRMSYYSCHHKGQSMVCIPSVAYDPGTMVLYFNGTNHFCCTWLHNPASCEAKDVHQMLSGFRAVAEGLPMSWVLDMKQEQLLSAHH